MITDQQFFEALGPNKVFELVYRDHLYRWRAFYRCRPHSDNPSKVRSDYRFVDGHTPHEAVELALAMLIKERLTS